jgi:hypothetical protein
MTPAFRFRLMQARGRNYAISGLSHGFNNFRQHRFARGPLADNGAAAAEGNYWHSRCASAGKA